MPEEEEVVLSEEVPFEVPAEKDVLPMIRR
jgi:hypothetical protein